MAGGFRVVLVALMMLPRAGWADGVRVFAAGSLTGAFGEIVKVFPGALAPVVFGPSGVLRERIEHGEAADILASADMAQARRLAVSGQPVILFTRNRLCALGRAGLTTDTLLERMLDPSVRLATSTPRADPAGDYAWAAFARAEAVRPGARAVLEAKALKLFGGPDSKPLVPGHGLIEGVFLAGRADIVLSYCSGFGTVIAAVPGLVSVALPASISVGADYGIVVLSDDPVAARFALFVMSEQGQAILLRFGFDPVGVAGDR